MELTFCSHWSKVFGIRLSVGGVFVCLFLLWLQSHALLAQKVFHGENQRATENGAYCNSLKCTVQMGDSSASLTWPAVISISLSLSSLPSILSSGGSPRNLPAIERAGKEVQQRLTLFRKVIYRHCWSWGEAEVIRNTTSIFSLNLLLWVQDSLALATGFPQLVTRSPFAIYSFPWAGEQDKTCHHSTP